MYIFIDFFWVSSVRMLILAVIRCGMRGISGGEVCVTCTDDPF